MEHGFLRIPHLKKIQILIIKQYESIRTDLLENASILFSCKTLSCCNTCFDIPNIFILNFYSLRTVQNTPNLISQLSHSSSSEMLLNASCQWLSHNMTTLFKFENPFIHQSRPKSQQLELLTSVWINQSRLLKSQEPVWFSVIKIASF